MTTFLLIIHTTACIFLISVVLLQSSKGAEMGAAFGGSSQTLFGSRGAATFLSKLTTICAVVFMITSLLLAVLSVKSGSVIKHTAPLEQKPFQTVPQQGAVPAPQPQAPVQQAPQPPK
ncbi:MAG TPA: preprotein translocase subunit SecG [Thermodesulfovibrionales bacterium]|jgi:preprotein translocase subunit SecG|nr:preprotein translocase subunit SecG [Thermodesulfovibrionales bacterium]